MVLQNFSFNVKINLSVPIEMAIFVVLKEMNDMSNETRFTEKDGKKIAIKAVEYIDRLWFDKKDNCIVGDMGYTFVDMPETRTTELGTLAPNVEWYAGEDMVENLEWDTPESRKEDNVPIYIVYQSDFEEEVDDDEDFCAWAADENEDTRKVVFIGVYASEEEAKALGVDEAIKKYEAVGKITYLNPETKIAEYFGYVEQNQKIEYGN